ncbi:hypothetical protein ACQKLN_13415 [Paenibacillus glucanolyticus]|uniref:hypothetical protein n=1 Tax=Paenibacillus glucanolyticus TaxID=59843 RepID=UPI0036D05E9D
MEEQPSAFAKSEFSSDSKPISPGTSDYLELTAPTNGRPFFWGFEIPDDKKVLFLGLDVAGTQTLKLRYFNIEAAGTTPVTVRAFIRQ